MIPPPVSQFLLRRGEYYCVSITGPGRSSVHESIPRLEASRVRWRRVRRSAARGGGFMKDVVRVRIGEVSGKWVERPSTTGTNRRPHAHGSGGGGD